MLTFTFNSFKHIDMSTKVKAHYVICSTLAIIDLALQSSWSGYNVIAEYNGAIYELYKDNDGKIHEALMRIVAPTINIGDSIEVLDSKYNPIADGLTKDWPDFNSFPQVEVNPSDMAETLKWAYNIY